MSKLDFKLDESKCEEMVANKLWEIINDQESDIFLQDVIFDDEVISKLRSIKEKLMNMKFKVVINNGSN